MKEGTSLMVTAGPCPVNPAHSPTRVTSTQGRVRYCVCDQCGERWQKVGERAEAVGQFLNNLAKAFRDAPKVENGGRKVCVFDAAEIEAAADQCDYHAELKPRRETRNTDVALSYPSLNDTPTDNTLATLKKRRNL